MEIKYINLNIATHGFARATQVKKSLICTQYTSSKTSFQWLIINSHFTKSYDCFFELSFFILLFELNFIDYLNTSPTPR